MSKSQALCRSSRRLAGAVVAGLLAAPLITALTAASDASTDGHPRGTTLQPARIDRAEDTRLLHAEGKVIVDRDTRVRVRPGKHMWLLGRSGQTYVVEIANAHYEDWRLLRVTRGGKISLLRAGDQFPADVELSNDGRHVAVAKTKRDRTRVRDVDAVTGEVRRTRWFKGAVELEDYGVSRIVLSEYGNKRMRTFWWTPRTNRQTRISNHPAYVADIAADRLGLVTIDSPEATCQKVVRLTAPSSTLWRSCDDRALTFSPDGGRMMTTYILADGPGPRMVQVRRGHGKVLATYRSEWFGFMVWENRKTVLLESAGLKYTRDPLRAASRLRARVTAVPAQGPGVRHHALELSDPALSR